MKTAKLDKYIINEDGTIIDGNYNAQIIPSIDHHGNLQVRLYVNSRYRNYTLDKLIAETFLGKKPSGHIIVHKDGSKYNNKLSNLEYVKVVISQEIKKASELPKIPVEAYDPYNMEAYYFESIDKAALYLSSIYVTDDSIAKIKVNIYNSLDKNELVYNYKWIKKEENNV